MFKKYFQQFSWFLDYYKKDYIIGLICLTLSNILTLLPPRLLGNTTDAIVLATIDGKLLLGNIALISGIGLINYFFNYLWGYKIFRAGDEIDRLARIRIFDRILKQGPHFFAKNSTGSIMGKATNDVEALSDFAGYGAMAFYDATVWPVMLLLMMLSISPKITLLSLIPYPFLVIFAKVIGAKLYRYYEEAQEAFDAMNESVLEGVAGVRVVRAYNLEEKEIKRFGKAADRLFQKNMRAVIFSQLYGPATRLIPALAFIIAMFFGIFEIRRGSLSTGDLLTFSFYLNMLSWPMISIGEFIITAQQGSASMERIDALLREELDVPDRENTSAFPENTDILVEHLYFQYPLSKGEYALEDISFTLREGETLGVVGPVGSGKTSLLRQFLHFYPLEKNRVFIGGKDLADLNRDELRKHIAYVPQQSFLFSKSIKDNILLGASNEQIADGSALDRLENVLIRADLAKDLPQFVDGLATEAGEKGIALSGGQKQRISIARALMKEASILILDDCLSAVDALTEENILSALQRERKGKTSLIAAHRLSAVKHADKILVLQEGRISEVGSHDELIKLGGWYKEQYVKQQLEPAK